MASFFSFTSLSITLFFLILFHKISTGIYGPKGIEVPNPIQSICTKWGSDPLSYGSYSHVRIHSSGSDYDILAENVQNRLFFAGEATNRQHPATMHGAYLSGLREASCIYRVMNSGNKQSQQPKKITKKVNGIGDVLVNLFKYPDFTLGNFLFVFDPSNENGESTGLMMVAIDESCNGRVNTGQSQSQAVKLYAVVTRGQAREMEEEVGGGGERVLSYMSEKFGLRLMGMDRFALVANSLITSIATRRGRVRNRVVFGSRLSYT